MPRGPEAGAAVQAHGDEGKLRLALAVFLGRKVHAWRLEVGSEAILSVLDAHAHVCRTGGCCIASLGLSRVSTRT